MPINSTASIIIPGALKGLPDPQSPRCQRTGIELLVVDLQALWGAATY